ncbi:acyl-CoA dehydrogenase family protein [Nonomuraea zeae]|uniref:Acyl-CoA dehydrogenase n=1 Tax=Nonomuraea zeae TaxID=1642303 RepID=A0A5S4GIW6_9ACTN|nr:acyl-CoA dehydrogenase family protein [Nonomuraea zeae]TMR32897.1 acyl-CoA dehydrogenase [Nonomuraea zeae]
MTGTTAPAWRRHLPELLAHIADRAATVDGGAAGPPAAAADGVAAGMTGSQAATTDGLAAGPTGSPAARAGGGVTGPPAAYLGGGGVSDPCGLLRDLGRRELLALDAGPGDTGVTEVAQLIELIAAECLSSAFSFWAHRMVIEYLREAGRDTPLGLLRAGLAAGTEVGSTAMAAALQEMSGMRTVPVVATPHAGGFRLDGPIRWASNLVPGAAVVLPARIGDGSERIVAVVRVGDPGVTVAPPKRLLALNATASSSITLSAARVDAAHVVTDDLAAFVRRARPVLLLLQTAFCLGLAGRATDETRGIIKGEGAVLGPDLEELTAGLAGVAEQARRAQRAPAAADPHEVTRLRYDAAQLTLAATRLEATASGGRGYATDSPVNRRLREAAFLPVQSPSETQLRWELGRAGKDVHRSGLPVLPVLDGQR